MATSGSTGWNVLNHNVSYKVDWQFSNFNYNDGTVTLLLTPYYANKTNNDIIYTTTAEFYFVFNNQSTFFMGMTDETYFPANYEHSMIGQSTKTFNIPKNGDLSNVSIGIKLIENGVETGFAQTFSLPNFSNNFIKNNNNWYRGVAWLKISGVWKRCKLWKKINGTWKKGE